MAKAKSVYVCAECGAEHARWQGRCSACGEWNQLSPMRLGAAPPSALGYSGAQAEVQKLSEVKAAAARRLATGSSEFDRVLGGGFVPGSVVLMGGDPGAGKSTLLLQICAQLGAQAPVLYVTGEESLQQLALRAERLGLNAEGLQAATETRAEAIVDLVESRRPALLVVDSIQVMQLQGIEGAPGGHSQVRESAACLTRLAKASGTATVLIGHITKEGSLAGPKVLEHMIDCFMMLDSPPGSRFRTLRGLKNRFGAVNELGVFAMTNQGMKAVANPSAIFLQRAEGDVPGSLATVIWEGTRPILVELQALVDQVQGSHPRRVALGLDAQRLAMHLAVLHRHCGVQLADQDVFANAVGGVRIAETGADLAALLAVLSSFRDRPLPKALIAFGELGLTGELRAVANGQERLKEARKHGFAVAIVPYANRPRPAIDGMTVHAVRDLGAALEALAEIS